MNRTASRLGVPEVEGGQRLERGFFPLLVRQEDKAFPSAYLTQQQEPCISMEVSHFILKHSFS